MHKCLLGRDSPGEREKKRLHEDNINIYTCSVLEYSNFEGELDHGVDPFWLPRAASLGCCIF